jgi:hypothetical protein
MFTSIDLFSPLLFWLAFAIERLTVQVVFTEPDTLPRGTPFYAELVVELGSPFYPPVPPYLLYLLEDTRY